MLLAVRYWIVLALSITGICGLIYLAVQQDIRLSANDPQIQISEDIASQLESGVDPSKLVSKEKIDISKSLSLFVVIFNDKKEVMVGNAILDGKSPILPNGVFDYTKTIATRDEITWQPRGGKEDRITWQPKDGVRIAAIVKYFNNGGKSGYVLAGRSLAEVEKREMWLEEQVGLTWGGLMVGTFLLSIILNRARR